MITASEQRRGAAPVAALVALALALVGILSLTAPLTFQKWNERFGDQLYLLRNHFPEFQPVYRDLIVHVDINDSALQQLGSFYLTRSQYARVMRSLAAMGVSLQAYDIIFASRMNAREDDDLRDAASEAGNAYFGMAFRLLRDKDQATPVPAQDSSYLDYLQRIAWHPLMMGDTSSFYAGFRPLLTFLDLAVVSRGLGCINVQPDSDGVFRRIPLLIRFGEDYHPSLALRLACDILQVDTDRIEVYPGRHLILPDALPPGEMRRDITVPINEKGEMRVNFVGAWERMRHYSFADIYQAAADEEEMALWKRELQGKVAIVSDVSTASVDMGPVPTDVNFPLSGLHAMALHTILTEGFIKEPSRPANLMAMLILAALTFAVCRVSGVLLLPVYLVVLGALVVGGAAAGFLHGRLFIHVVEPLAFLVLTGILVSGYRYVLGAKEREVLKRTLEAYFPASIVRRIVADPRKLALGGQKKELTVLFSDIKEFTSHSSRMSPAQVQRLLNEYFEAMVEIVFRHQGTVDKYMGDGLMVFFGDPESQPDHALRAVETAVDMQRRVAELRDRWLEETGFPVRIRIGINTGEVVVGNMGSSQRLAYTVIGSPVNLAQRLESNAPVGGILISEATRRLVQDRVRTRPLGPIRVKGMEEPVEVHEVLFR